MLSSIVIARIVDMYTDIIELVLAPGCSSLLRKLPAKSQQIQSKNKTSITISSRHSKFNPHVTTLCQLAGKLTTKRVNRSITNIDASL